MAKDLLGNPLKVGDLVHVQLEGGSWVTAKVKEIKAGGSIIPIGKDKTGMMAGVVTTEAVMQSPFDPSKGIVTDMIKIYNPKEVEGEQSKPATDR